MTAAYLDKESIITGLLRTLLMSLGKALFKIIPQRVAWPTGIDACAPFIKVYDVRPMLPVRIFYPKGYEAIRESSPSKRWPLWVDIHGGGWAIGNASDDDGFCAWAAERCDCIVTSVTYRKSPRWQFPTQLDDIESVMMAIFEDPSLPVDPSRVCVGGFSAGGNLALAVAQNHLFKIRAVVAFYPLTEIMQSPRVPSSRPRSNREADLRSDPLIPILPALERAYVPAGTDIRNARLSPIYADRRQGLTQNLYIIGAEDDILCEEARRMACRMTFLSEQEGLALEMEIGRPGAGDARGWEKDGVVWEEILASTGQVAESLYNHTDALHNVRLDGLIEIVEQT